MPEKKMQSLTSATKRLLFYVVSLSILLLFISCFILLGRSSDTRFTGSVISTRSLPPATLSSTRTDKDTRVLGQRDIESCNLSKASLKVFMYELPPEFHFGLLGWKGKRDQIWPDVGDFNAIPRYPGGLNLQHSVEYWMTLDLLSSNSPGVGRPCSAVRVKNSGEADVIFVPFFSSLSYNRLSKLRKKETVSRDMVLQADLIKFLKNQEYWKRWGGSDHLIVAHHPNSMLEARMNLSSAMLVLADFGRYPVEIANIEKDIVAPYKHLVKSASNNSASFNGRPVLLFFQGAIYRKDGGMIRQELYKLLKDEKDVHFAYGSARTNGIKDIEQGMASSKFCLNIAGDTPSSNRLFDAIASHCIPVVISDEIELPFEDVLDYSEFCLFVRASDAIRKNFLLNLIRGISRDEWTKMWERIKQVAGHFEYQYPSKPGDAVQMIWEGIARKVSSLRLRLHKEKRFRQE